MDPRHLAGCPTSLMRMVLEPNPSTERLERDLNVVMNELRRQVTLTASLRNEWYNLMHSTTLGKMQTAERLQILYRFLLDAHLAKERHLRLGTRFVFTDRIYEFQSQTFGQNVPTREQWLTQPGGMSRQTAMELVERDVRRLEITIKEVTEYLELAARDIRTRRRELDAANILEKTMQEMQNCLKKTSSSQEASTSQQQDDTIGDLLRRIDALEKGTSGSGSSLQMIVRQEVPSVVIEDSSTHKPLQRTVHQEVPSAQVKDICVKESVQKTVNKEVFSAQVNVNVRESVQKTVRQEVPSVQVDSYKMKEKGKKTKASDSSATFLAKELT
ncbi:unnamed protein product [Heligmosomoides polygyrus]|uniref:BAG domain-containing protein n=1 Tax=Heligmosomoides polygyrus TaxID=6339 RepID=A0A183GST1_HELPZ|nr:unnamed protein product [Heligmosomoides polygyrus]